MRKFLVLLCLFANSAFAARLEDVRVLDGKAGKDGLELKLQVKDGPKDSYFIVTVVKSDPDFIDKLALVIRKLKKENEFKLTLDIPSFSVSPPGSHYRSEYVSFSGNDLHVKGQ